MNLSKKTTRLPQNSPLKNSDSTVTDAEILRSWWYVWY